MKKIIVLLLTALMLVSVGTASVFAEGGWQDNVKIGKNGSLLIEPGADGAYTKVDEGDLLEDGIQEDVNIFVDVDGMSQGQLFEASVSVKTAGNTYKTEQVIMLQKDGEAVIVSGNGLEGYLSLTESKIYNFMWDIYTDEDKYIYATVTVSDLEGNEIGQLQSGKLINADSGLDARYDEGDHLGYLWIFNVQTDNGVHVYENTECIDLYVKSDWTLDGATVEGTEDNYTIKGGQAFNYANISKQLINGVDEVYDGIYGIEEKLNFFINLDEMAVGELFETSVGIKDIKDDYKTEQVVMIQKVDTNKVKFTGNEMTGEVVAEGSRLYTLDWKFFKDGENIKCVVEVYKNGTKQGELVNANLGAAVSGYHLGYVWIFNNQTSKGIHVCSDLANAPQPNIEFVGLDDTYYVNEEETFTVVTSYDGSKYNVKSNNTLPTDEYIDLLYKYKEEDPWSEFPNGVTFPLANSTATLKAKFLKTGVNNFVIRIEDPFTGELIYETTKTVTVIDRPAPAPTPAPAGYVIPKTGIN